MDYVTIILGLLIIIYGLYTLVVRKKAPEKFSKLTAMKEKLGEVSGNTAHVFFYTVMPIIFGALVVFAGSQGISLSQFFSN